MTSRGTPHKTRKRSLSGAEKSLWKAYTRDVTPIGADYPAELIEEESDRIDSISLSKTLSKTRSKIRSETPPPSQTSAHKPLAVGQISDIDRSTARKFTAGRLPVEACLDLHGLNQEQAHGRLDRFIGQAHSRGLRCVLVITGKGRQSGIGVLKTQVPMWLNMPRLRPHILAFSHARRRDGGEGALYVLIRRKRA